MIRNGFGSFVEVGVDALKLQTDLRFLARARETAENCARAREDRSADECLWGLLLFIVPVAAKPHRLIAFSSV